MQPLIHTLSFEQLRQAKKNASKSLEALDIQLSSSTTGNLVANIFGYQDWNIVKAKTEITVEISANLDILENVTDLSIPIYSFPGKKDLSTEIIGYTKIDNIGSLRVKAIEFSDFTDDNNGYYSYVDPVKPISKDGLMKVFYVSASLASGGKEHNEDDDFVVVSKPFTSYEDVIFSGVHPLNKKIADYTVKHETLKINSDKPLKPITSSADIKMFKPSANHNTYINTFNTIVSSAILSGGAELIDAQIATQWLLDDVRAGLDWLTDETMWHDEEFDCDLAIKMSMMKAVLMTIGSILEKESDSDIYIAEYVDEDYGEQHLRNLISDNVLYDDKLLALFKVSEVKFLDALEKARENSKKFYKLLV